MPEQCNRPIFFEGERRLEDLSRRRIVGNGAGRKAGSISKRVQAAEDPS